MKEEEIIINKIAQGKTSIESGIEWFDSLSDSDRKRAIFLTKFFTEQSHPNEKIIETAISKIPLKPTMTPIVILKTNNFKVALSKISKLPEDEYRKAFITLITTYKESDTYRRNTWCKDGCSHEWHNLKENTTYNNVYKKLLKLVFKQR
ncbi:DUF5958 family protein [Algibacter sp. Ld11]|uniref:DUF5958 family protein n=1 Tax=Algibacter sp. Ld11 TaxID=649150 RepID=UPI00386BA915